ncbi:hypothetical protein MTP03_39290 [Tsukamurella sp. PLM1]|nr:hypothetical protein MTP03_39290 [Tsukamurella sp. PLM1]
MSFHCHFGFFVTWVVALLAARRGVRFATHWSYTARAVRAFGLAAGFDGAAPAPGTGRDLRPPRRRRGR